LCDRTQADGYRAIVAGGDRDRSAMIDDMPVGKQEPIASDEEPRAAPANAPRRDRRFMLRSFADNALGASIASRAHLFGFGSRDDSPCALVGLRDPDRVASFVEAVDDALARCMLGACDRCEGKCGNA
jgi:hypothetical protein